jgi:hypothetical protein
MHFILFLTSAASNALVLLSIPHLAVAEFLNILTLANIVFSLLFTLMFSYNITAKLAPYWLVTACMFSIVAVAFLPDFVIWIVYPLSLLGADYATSQTGSTKLSYFYRISIILSTIPFLVSQSFFDTALLCRTGISLIFILYSVSQRKDFSKLIVNSPFRMILVTYTFYSGSLLMLTIIPNTNPLSIKFWYVGSQIGLGLILKLIDFKIRSIASTFSLINQVILLFASLLPILLFTIYPSFLYLAIYSISALALGWLAIKI